MDTKCSDFESKINVINGSPETLPTRNASRKRQGSPIKDSVKRKSTEFKKRFVALAKRLVQRTHSMEDIRVSEGDQGSFTRLELSENDDLTMVCSS